MVSTLSEFYGIVRTRLAFRAFAHEGVGYECQSLIPQATEFNLTHGFLYSMLGIQCVVFFHF